MVDISSLPVPPPWSEVHSRDRDGEPTVTYVHDVTGEATTEHPLARLQRRQEERRRLAEQGDGLGPGAEQADGQPSGPRSSEVAPHSPIPEVDAGEDVQDESADYSDFDCKWKECSAGTKDRYYSVTLRYFNDSGRMAVRFTGLSAVWKYSTLQGVYGPLTRYDLFIGAQITLFSRHLTVKTTTANVCHWIDNEAELLERQRLWLQEKISSSGVVPVVRKEPHLQLRHVERLTSTTGTKNLRKIHIQVCKLREQLCDLGLEHFADMMPKRPVSKAH